VKVCALANSKNILFDAKGIDLSQWHNQLELADKPFAVTELAQVLQTTGLTNIALIDCTASEKIVSAYSDFIEKSIHIVTPNKKANVLPWADYQHLLTLLAKYHCHFLFEANVGAGLPIISTLQDLTISGDTILSIEGIFSGTLSYLFNQYDGKLPFSAIIREAHAAGLTEPDPREDLSGQDVARKLLILARLLGRKMDFEEVAAENLVPISLQTGAFSEEFYEAYQAYDETLQRKFIQAEKNQCVLRYVGTLDEKGARAELREIPRDHPLALAKKSDNIITFTTKRYAFSPLVIQGPGAGAEVTAMGVFSDIVRLLHYLPH
jgi:aspartokinase/homoserine dehydrogenase 1